VEFFVFFLVAVIVSVCLILMKYAKKNKELEYDNAYLSSLFQNSLDGILVLDNEDRIVCSNDSFHRIFQYDEEETKGLYVNDLIAGIEFQDAYEASRIALGGNIVVREVKRKRKDGQLVNVQVNGFPFMVDGVQQGILAVYEDTTVKNRLGEELKLQKTYFSHLFENSPDAVCIVDNEDRFVSVNPSFEKLFGYSREEALNKYLNDIIVQKEYYNEATMITKDVLKGKVVLQDAIRMRKDGKFIEVNIIGYPIILDNEKMGVLGIYRDIAEEKKTRKQLEFFSYHDHLTGLFNKRFADKDIKMKDVGSNLPLSIIIADVNGLKLINDSFGHAAGDELLMKVAGALKAVCRPVDVIARRGGDEFIVLMPNTDYQGAERIVQNMKEVISKESVASIEISISTGLATKTSSDEDIMELVKKADDQMYRNKIIEKRGMGVGALNAIIRTLYEKSKGEEEHSLRVSSLCMSIGREIGLEEEDIEELGTMGMLHDIGKVSIDGSILNAKRELTEDEWVKLKSHAKVGSRILNSVDEMAGIAKYVLYHHERWDGKGYPKGLAKEQIPIQSRILYIADAYDTMTSDRCYGPALSEEDALEELIKNSGSQFDPKLVNIFMRILENQ